MSFRQRFSSKWMSVLLVFAVIVMARQAVSIWVRARKLSHEADRIEDRVAELERDIARREAELEQVQDPDWLEYQARLRLNYKDPEEQVVVVYKEENADIIGAVASVSAEGGSRSWSARLWAWLAGVVQW